MKTPYKILNVAVDASDLEIKQAYLQKVKDNPPDRDQEQFQLIHDAYTSIKDHKSRIGYDLFNLPVADFDTLINQALTTDHTIEFNAEHLKKLLSASSDDTTHSMSLPTQKK